MSQEVIQLANISLLRQRDQWKQKLTQIQKAIDATIGACGCQVADAKPWKSHWDYQIFKIMEVGLSFVRVYVLGVCKMCVKRNAQCGSTSCFWGFSLKTRGTVPLWSGEPQ